MSNRFSSPNQQFVDENGLPYAGGNLAFYASQTAVPLATYSDRALTIPNSNPIVLDSAGRAGSIFLQNLAYKVALNDVNGVQIWLEDPVYSSDFSTVAQVLTYPGSPNGAVAGTAGTGSVPSSMIWDSVNQILYICTTTGSAGSAVWTAVNSSTSAAVVPPPQGRLTLASGTPILNSDVVNTGNVFYTPYVGNIIPIYNGSSFVPTTFSELNLTLHNQTASTVFDIFVFSNSGVVTIGIGPAWSNSASGSGARGSGPGTSQLTQISGIWVNNVAMLASNSTTSYTVAANQGTYVGSIYTDGISGVTTCYVSIGQNRKWGVWNAYNRKTISLLVADPANNWTYNSSTLRPANGSNSNVLVAFAGLAEESCWTEYLNSGLANSAGLGSGAIGIGWNANNNFSVGAIGEATNSSGGAGGVNAIARYINPPFLGIVTVFPVESVPDNTSTVVFQGGQNGGMLFSAIWQG